MIVNKTSVPNEVVTYNWTSSRHNRHTESEDETTSLELGRAVWSQDGQAVDETTDDNNAGSDEHSNFASPCVNRRTYEWKRGQATNLVDDRGDRIPWA